MRTRAGREWSLCLMVAALVVMALLPAAAVQGQGMVQVKAATVSTHWSVTLPVWVALSKGYWKNEGLDVKFSVVSPGSAHVPAFAGGSFQFSINLNTDVMARAASQGARIVAIMGSMNQNQYVLYGRPQIRTLTDLRGKRIAIDTPGGSHDTFVQEILTASGMSARDVGLVPVAGAIEVRVNAMVSGATDAAIGSIAQWPTLRDQGYNIITRLRDIHPDWQTAVNGVTQDLLDRNPAAVKGFIKGMIRAFQFAKDPKNEAALLRLAKEAKLVVNEARWGEELAIQREFWPADGTLNLKGTEIVLQRERAAGFVARDFTLDKFVRFRPLQEAQRELGLAR